jgi:hypothetical protein
MIKCLDTKNVPEFRNGIEKSSHNPLEIKKLGPENSVQYVKG